LKILIDNGGYEFRNNGDSAMLIVTAERFHRQYPNAEIQIFTLAPNSLKKIIPYAEPIPIAGRKLWLNAWNLLGGMHKLFPESFHPRLLKIETYLKIKLPSLSCKWMGYRLSKRSYDIKSMNEFVETVQRADIVIASGGGYITDAFEGHACNVLQTLALAQSYGIPTAMFGQGIGPIQSKKILSWVKKVYPKLKCLSLRERQYSKPCALSSGMANNIVDVTGDDAISLAQQLTPLKIGRKIGVNLRVATYSGLGEETLGQFKLILNDVAKKYNAELCAVPISFHDGDSDYSSLQKLLEDKQFDDKERLNTPEKVIKQVGQCRIVITGSYHAGVFALSQGISVVAVAASDYYRHKFEGLANQFSVGCYVIDRESAGFESDLKQAIDKAWLAAEKMRPELIKKAQEQVALSEAAYLKFYKGLS